MSDDLDDRILRELVRNGRATWAEIADAVGLSAHAVAARVRRLEKSGAISGYTAVVEESALGRGVAAYIDVRLLPTADPQKFEKVVLGLPATRKVVFVTGRFDYIVELACRDPADLDATVREIRTKGGVAATEARIVMRSL